MNRSPWCLVIVFVEPFVLVVLYWKDWAISGLASPKLGRFLRIITRVQKGSGVGVGDEKCP